MSGPDFEATPNASFCVLVPLTPAAKEWVDRHVGSGALPVGPGFAVEHRYLHDLCVGILESGLSLAHEGRQVGLDSDGSLTLC